MCHEEELGGCFESRLVTTTDISFRTACLQQRTRIGTRSEDMGTSFFKKGEELVV